MRLKDLLKSRLEPKELEKVPTSFDIIGSKEKAVAILELQPEVEKKGKIIAEALMQLHRNVKTVLQKLSERHGTFRLKEYRLLAGDPNTEVLHREHGFLLKLDPKKAYYSPRESTERQRVARQVKPGERVLVMFSGICPYPIAIAKRQPEVKIYAVELNPDAHRYAEENIRINGLQEKITALQGDVREICPRLGRFDRIIMPLAKDAWKYLDLAFSCCKSGGIVHFYSVAPEEDLWSEAEKKARDVAKKLGLRISIMNRKRVLPWGSRKWKICLDIRVDRGQAAEGEKLSRNTRPERLQ